jgi:hypothetical protein
MQLDALQVLTNVFVGAVSAWVAGTFGIRHGLERAKRERAFDRQLEWREKTVRTINRFLTSDVELRNVLMSGSSDPEDIRVLLKSLEAALDELDVSLRESVLFAERKIVIDLRDHIFLLEDLIARIKDRDERSDPRGIAETTGDLAKVLGSFRSRFHKASGSSWIWMISPLMT